MTSSVSTAGISYATVGPLAQRTSSRSTRVAGPSPKCTRRSDCDIWPRPLATSPRCRNPLAVQNTTEPIASRGQRRDGSPTRRRVSQCPARLPPRCAGARGHRRPRSPGCRCPRRCRNPPPPSPAGSAVVRPSPPRTPRSPRTSLEVPEQQGPLPVRRVPVEEVRERVDVAVGDDQVQPAVVVVVDERVPPAQEGDARARHSRGKAHVGEEAAAVVVVEDVVVVGEVRDVDVVASVVVVVADGHAHVGLLEAQLVEGRPRGVADVLEGAVATVAVEVVGTGVVGHEQVEPAVVVEIEEGHPEAEEAARVRHSGLRAHVGEGPVAVVVEQVVGGALEPAGSAHDGLAPVLAVGGARPVAAPIVVRAGWSVSDGF